MAEELGWFLADNPCVDGAVPAMLAELGGPPG
jgi:hypothetical protein